jgi:spermidine synthase
LNRSKNKYDYIIFDVFTGENTPFYVLSRESLQLISHRLNHGGILGINLVGSIKAETFVMASVIKTLQQVFTTVEIYPTFDPDKQKWPMGNLEIIAYNSPPLTLATARLKTWRFHPEAATARDNLGKKFAFPPETPGIILTDDYNPLDFYDLKVREGYRQWLLSRPNLEMFL